MMEVMLFLMVIGLPHLVLIAPDQTCLNVSVLMGKKLGLDLEATTEDHIKDGINKEDQKEEAPGLRTTNI